MIGITKPGFFAEYTLVDAANAVIIPDDVTASPAELSPIFCAGITVWDAVTRAKLVPGETVAIAGVGGWVRWRLSMRMHMVRRLLRWIFMMSS
jgi:Zn-dependent alcohol dehydrogenases